MDTKHKSLIRNTAKTEHMNDRIRQVLADEIETALGEHGGPAWQWLSFADGDLPKGQQFLGVVIMQAYGITSGLILARSLGLNPGGSVQCYELPFVPPPKYTYRLLNRTEANEANEEMKRLGK